jgi:hypothetical protein
VKASMDEDTTVLMEFSEEEAEHLIIEILESFSNRKLEKLPYLNAFRHLIDKVTTREPREWNSQKNRRKI